jgi:hypothetical protein
VIGAAVLAAAACSSSEAVTPDASPFGPGVAFVYPTDGQVDIPVGVRMVLHFTNAVDSAALAASCTQAADGTVTGNLCVVGPGGPVAIKTTVTGASMNVVDVTSDALLPGTAYQIFARPALVAGGATGNLPTNGPLVTFVTRQQTSRPGVVPAVVSINDQDPAGFQDGSGKKAPLPFLDFTTIHLLFSEPLDEKTVAKGSTFVFGKMGGDGSVTPVAGQLYLRGVHLAFDPDDDLDPGAHYVISLAAGIQDLDGEALAPVAFDFHPVRSKLADGTRPQLGLKVSPAANPDGSSTAASPLAGAGANTVIAQSQLLGNQQLGLLPGYAVTELADPAAFGGPTFFSLRKGQRLDVSNLVLNLDGDSALPTGTESGTIHFLVLTDANGYMYRSPLQPSKYAPDDTYSPVTVDMVFDAAQYSDDPTGNAVVTQTLLSVHVRGTAVVDNGQLAVETVGAVELDALGISLATANMVMSLRTDQSGTAPATPTPPLALVGSLPYGGQPDFYVDAPLVINFSQPVQFNKADGSPAISLTDQAGHQVRVTLVPLGSSAVVYHDGYLAYDTQYTLDLTQVVGITGTTPTFDSGDNTAGTGLLTFRTPVLSTAHQGTPPIILSSVPGAPCALTGTTVDAPGHCAGGKDSDIPYLPFTLPANRKIDVYFNQPMDPASMTLASACGGAGSIHVETIDASGACTGAVPGTLIRNERNFQFNPASPWTVGQTYRLTMHAGADLACDANELCSTWSHLPLDTVPLLGIEGHGGGPDVIENFTAIDATADGYQPLITLPIPDSNGNGYLDPGEILDPLNKLEVEVTSTSGLITSATLAGDDCDPNRPGTQVCGGIVAATPVNVGPVLEHCPEDMNGDPIDNGPHCTPITVHSHIVVATALTLTANVGVLPVTSTTGIQFQRSTEPDTAPIVGYIMDDGTGHPIFVVHEKLYLDAPDLNILGGVASADLQSKEINALLRGPITFEQDGRQQVHLITAKDINITINLTTLSLGTGSVTITIPAGGLSFNLRGPERR